MSEQEFILTRGIPASGKSTWAKKWLAADPNNRVRVNRDDIRETLYGKKYQQNSKDEERVTQIEHKLIRTALKEGKSVVSDNMHLNPRFMKPFYAMAGERGLKLQHRDFPIPLDEALRRNAARERVVPADVIRKIYSQNLGPNGEMPYFDGDYTPRPFVKPETKKTGVIYDMDGTMTRISSIRHHVNGKFRNFDAFHRGSLHCPPNLEVLQLAQDTTEANIENVIVTARSEKYRAVTELWLNKYGVKFSNLYMRPDNDNRTDHLVKADILEKIQEDYDIVHAVDDRPSVIEVWNAAGIRTTLVPGLERENDPDLDINEEPHIVNPIRAGLCLRCGRTFKGEGVLGPTCRTKA